LSEDAVVERLKEGKVTDEDVALLTDDDVRQLVIYYASLIRNPAFSKETKSKIFHAWTSLPRPLWDRFFKVVAESEEKFWVRPADLNNRFGIG